MVTVGVRWDILLRMKAYDYIIKVTYSISEKIVAKLIDQEVATVIFKHGAMEN